MALFLVYVALFAIHTYLHIATNSGLRRARVRLLGGSLPGLCTAQLPSEDAVARRRHRQWFSFSLILAESFDLKLVSDRGRVDLSMVGIFSTRAP